MFHLMHKPAGATSFSLVQARIEALKQAAPHRRPRVCHAGALDPFASGLLIVLDGAATRLFDHLHAIPKVYEATIRWGVETDNGDPTGKPVFTAAEPFELSAGRLDEALAAHVGWHEQVPPNTSNKRVGGERAYVKAHRGEAFELPASRVYLHEANWVDHDLPGRRSRLRLVARGGYYIRSLARDLGRQLGCGAHLADLHRTAIGPYADPGEGKEAVVSGPDLMPWLPARVLSDFELGELRQGRAIPVKEIGPVIWPLPAGFPGDADPPIRAIHRAKLVYLLSAQEDGTLKAKTEFPRGL
jgi:tRNA pseudouridine55 synthase